MLNTVRLESQRLDVSDHILMEHKGIDYLACFKCLRVVNPDEFTCPVKTMVLLAHNQPIDTLRADSGAFSYFSLSFQYEF